MFTGIIQAVGRVKALQNHQGDARISLQTGDLAMADVQLGDSIAVNGVCLTAVSLESDGFTADVSRETLNLTSLGRLKPGGRVNLEKALTLNTPLGGHLVSGHVDGLGRILQRGEDARSVRFHIQAPKDLMRYIAPKGSICVDGTSLTVNQVEGNVIGLNIVPHTLGETIMGSYRQGTEVNLEVDQIARYLERLLLTDSSDDGQPAGITEAFLARHGFFR